jgi:Ca2+/Na+ antiporter
VGGRRRTGRRAFPVNVLIVVLGVLGLVVAAAALIDLVVDASRHRQFIDIVIVVVAAAVAVWLLIAYGDRIMQ